GRLADVEVDDRDRAAGAALEDQRAAIEVEGAVARSLPDVPADREAPAGERIGTLPATELAEQEIVRDGVRPAALGESARPGVADEFIGRGEAARAGEVVASSAARVVAEDEGVGDGIRPAAL